MDSARVPIGGHPPNGCRSARAKSRETQHVDPLEQLQGFGLCGGGFGRLVPSMAALLEIAGIAKYLYPNDR